MLSTWVVVALVVAGCAPEQDASRAEPPTGSSVTAPATTPDPGASAGAPERDTTRTEGVLIATATVDQVEAFAEPDDRGEPTHVLEHPAPVGAPRVFLVDERRDGWIQVLLPVRPNGTTGWIREADVELTRTSYRVEVLLGDFLLRVHRGDEVVLETTIGYGAEDTPTPGGRYYLTELLQPPDPDGLYGPYAFGLSGFSEVHRSFAGGEGVIGIHGTNDPSSLGRRVSNGCIRIENRAITELASMLPLGTPVTIES